MKPRTILFLDDSEERITSFLKSIDTTKDIATIARTAQDAIKALSYEPFDIVMLDHDLGGQVFQSSDDENSGMAVVRWILKNKPVISMIVIHSWNPVASHHMAIDLSRAGYNVVRKAFGVDNLYLAE